MFQIQQQGVVGNHDTPAFEQLIRAIARGTGSHELVCYACRLSLGGQSGGGRLSCAGSVVMFLHMYTCVSLSGWCMLVA